MPPIRFPGKGTLPPIPRYSADCGVVRYLNKRPDFVRIQHCLPLPWRRNFQVRSRRIARNCSLVCRLTAMCCCVSSMLRRPNQDSVRRPTRLQESGGTSACRLLYLLRGYRLQLFHMIVYCGLLPDGYIRRRDNQWHCLRCGDVGRALLLLQADYAYPVGMPPVCL